MYSFSKLNLSAFLLISEREGQEYFKINQIKIRLNSLQREKNKIKSNKEFIYLELNLRQSMISMPTTVASKC